MSLQKTHLLSLIFLLFVSVAKSQFVKNYTIADGLPGNSLKCLFKDSRGVMWISTETGLCTFDGFKFKVWGKEQGLVYNSVWKITEDNKKNIWLSLFGSGIAKYDGKKFTYFSEKNGLVNNTIRSLYFDNPSNCLILGSEDGLSLFDGKKFKNFKPKTKSPMGRFQVNFISKFASKIIFGVNQENLYELIIDKNNLDKSTIKRFYNPKTINYSGIIVGNNFVNRSLGSEFELHNLKTKTKQAFGPCSLIWDFAVDNDKNIYCAAWDVNLPTGGIFKFRDGQLTDISKKMGLPSCQFWCIYFDPKSEQLWAGSIDKGIFVIDLSEKISYLGSDYLGIPNPVINSFTIDKQGSLWYGGLNFISRKNKSGVKSLSNQELSAQILKFIKKGPYAQNEGLLNLLKNSKEFIVYSIKQDESGAIWALTTYGLLALNDQLQLTNFEFYTETGGVFDFIDSKKLLVSQLYNFAYTNVIRNLEKGQKFIFYKKKVIALEATKIVKARTGLWISSYTKGLFLYEKGKMLSMNDLGFLDETYIMDLFVDENQNIVVGTVSGKVYVFKWENHKLVQLKLLEPEKQLEGSTIFFIRKWREYLIVGTNKGVNFLKYYKPHTVIDFSENLQLSQYSDANIDHRLNRLLISYDKGLMSLNLNKILKKQSVNSPIVISQIKINQKLVKVQNLSLEHLENNIEISFVSNNLYNPIKNQYRYKIKGLSENWSSYSSENNIKIFGLNAGDYKLIIEGKNEGTNEKIRAVSLGIIVHPPVWKTTWFICIVLLIVILSIVISLRLKIERIKQKEGLKKSIAKTKLKALQSQMNPHFTFNAMNSIQNFVIDNKTDEALNYIGEFSKLMRQTLEFSSKKSVPLHEEIEYLKRYILLENLRRTSKVEYTIRTSEAVSLSSIEIPPLLIQPLIENTFMHAFDRTSIEPRIGIEFSCSELAVICQVTDNGKGFDMGHVPSANSKGIKLVEERIQLLEGSTKNPMHIESKPGSGTHITITIPLR